MILILMVFQPDYDAPLTEAGDYTNKYDACREIVAKYNKVLTKLPLQPVMSKKMAYGPVSITGQLNFNQIIDKVVSLFDKYMYNMLCLVVSSLYTWGKFG
jgi:hypothetical protein